MIGMKIFVKETGRHDLTMTSRWEVTCIFLFPTQWAEMFTDTLNCTVCIIFYLLDINLGMSELSRVNVILYRKKFIMSISIPWYLSWCRDAGMQYVAWKDSTDFLTKETPSSLSILIINQINIHDLLEDKYLNLYLVALWPPNQASPGWYWTMVVMNNRYIIETWYQN